MWGFHDGSAHAKILELDRKVEALDQRFTRVTADVLDACERLDRITKRSFRLKEQLMKLEEPAKPADPPPVDGEDEILAEFYRQQQRR
jgi:hypothetical protein